MKIRFNGRISSRSSRRETLLAGEKELLECNPARRQMIIDRTNWKSLYAGSLNIEVESRAVHRLLMLHPAIIEDAANIRYPDGTTHIQETRIGYLYYFASIVNQHVPCLVRRACKALKHRVELFAPVSIKDTLRLRDGQTIVIQAFDEREFINVSIEKRYDRSDGLVAVSASPG